MRGSLDFVFVSGYFVFVRGYFVFVSLYFVFSGKNVGDLMGKSEMSSVLGACPAVVVGGSVGVMGAGRIETVTLNLLDKDMDLVPESYLCTEHWQQTCGGVRSCFVFVIDFVV